MDYCRCNCVASKFFVNKGNATKTPEKKGAIRGNGGPPLAEGAELTSSHGSVRVSPKMM
jgi:hypothetical protein